MLHAYSRRRAENLVCDELVASVMENWRLWRFDCEVISIPRY